MRKQSCYSPWERLGFVHSTKQSEPLLEYTGALGETHEGSWGDRTVEDVSRQLDVRCAKLRTGLVGQLGQ